MSEREESEDSTQVPFNSAITPESDGHSSATVAELIILARQAIEQKRLKQCIVLVKDILKIDPYHGEARQLQSRIRSHLKQDLAKARVYLSASGETYEQFLIKKARSIRQRRLYSRAENRLHAILDVDPEHEEAKNLLSLVSSLQRVSHPQMEDESRGPFVARAAATGLPRIWIWAVLGVLILLGASGALWFSMSGSGASNQVTGLSKPDDVHSTQAPIARDVAAPKTGSLALLVAPLKGVQMSLNDGPPKAVPDSVELKPGLYRLRFTADGYSPKTVSETVVAGKRRKVVVILTVPSPATVPALGTAQAISPTEPLVSVLPDEKTSGVSAAIQTPQETLAAATTGTLALNAQMPVDVYLGDKYLGFTPLRLQLPSGVQTLEARYQDLRKMVSYVIKSNETTVATITFEVMVQINANPWAEVFIEASQPKPLGETPLSVTTPVGSVLVFKNPNFPEKKYRVTGKEASIRIVFP